MIFSVLISEFTWISFLFNISSLLELGRFQKYSISILWFELYSISILVDFDRNPLQILHFWQVFGISNYDFEQICDL